MNPEIRKTFPALYRQISNQDICFLDGPAGTQVPNQVIDAISNYYKTSNSNTHGAFAFTRETDEMMHRTREIIAKFFNASSYQCISFGQNMTSLNYSLSRAIGRYLESGDEIIITQLDHESNRGPWLALRSLGIVVKEVLVTKNGTLDYDDFAMKVSDKTRLVCMGMASNYTGTVNDVQFARKISHKVGAKLLLDAVHYAPHFSLDVQNLGCDFLLCSAYKFYGPHVGLLYAKKGLLDRLPTDRLRTTYQYAPYSIETGTLNHAAIAGVKASIEFISQFGEGEHLRDKLLSAFSKIELHEKVLANQMISFINTSATYHLVGPTYEESQRAPTISFYSDEKSATYICEALAAKNIFAWSGHFYAIRASEVLGHEEKGGVVRMGMSYYTTQKEVDFTMKVLEEIG